jgi:hypothetical protein
MISSNLGGRSTLSCTGGVGALFKMASKITGARWTLEKAEFTPFLEFRVGH